MSDRDGHKYTFADPVSNWHFWFAWHPVRTWDKKLVWLRRVERRLLAIHNYLSYPCDNWFEYHLPEPPK